MDDNTVAITAARFNFSLRTHRNTTAASFKGTANPCPPHDNPTGGEIRPRDNLHHIFKGNLRVADICHTGINDFSRVMRRNIGRHPNGNAARAIDQKIGVFSRQNRWFFLGFIIIGDEINSIAINIPQQGFSNLGQTRFCVTHGGWRVTIN